MPLERGHQRGVHPEEIIILGLLARLAWERLQIDTDLQLIITSTADELSGGTNIDYLERPWTLKIGVFSEFSRFQAAMHILRVNCAKTVQDRPGQCAYQMLRIKRRFQRCKVRPGRLKGSAVLVHQIRVPRSKHVVSATVVQSSKRTVADRHRLAAQALLTNDLERSWTPK